MGHSLDIAIAGCGPAGLAAGALLASDGHRVTIFERFDQAAPVGSGLLLQPTGMAVLDELGLKDALLRSGMRIDRLHGIADSRTVLDVRYDSLQRDDSYGTGIHRAALFDALYRAASGAGVTIVPDHHVRSSAIEGSGRALIFDTGKSDGPYDLVVDAMGARSPMCEGTARSLPYGAMWANVEWRDGIVSPNTLSQHYFHAEQMAGLLPLGSVPGSDRPMVALFWSVRGDRFDELKQQGIEAWQDQWLKLWPDTEAFCEQVQDFSQFQYARYAHRTLRQPVEERLIHIGDSWHSTSPQLGQGANMALLDALALARGLTLNKNEVAAALIDTVAMRKRHVALYQLMSLWLTPVYQSDGRPVPFLRDRLVGPMSGFDWVSRIQAAMVAGLIGNPLNKLGLG